MCWFDYTHLSDVERDERFASAYLDAYRFFYAKRTDANKAKYVNPVHKKNTRAWKLIPKGRQAADECSMPYDRYCQFAIAISDENNWTHLTAVNQLYSTQIKALVLDRWESENKYFLVLPELPCSSPEYHDYIKSAVDQHNNPQQLLYDLLRGRKLERLTAVQLFPQSLLKRVNELEVLCGAIPA